jgi:hypothetical protein
MFTTTKVARRVALAALLAGGLATVGSATGGAGAGKTDHVTRSAAKVINPQPLPPGSVRVINPQPLPPGIVRVINPQASPPERPA